MRSYAQGRGIQSVSQLTCIDENGYAPAPHRTFLSADKISAEQKPYKS